MNQIARIPSSLLASSHYRGYPVQFLIPFSPERWDELLFFLLPPEVARELLLKLIERYGVDHTPYHECVVVHFRKAHREKARNVLREVCGRDWAQCELPVWDGDTEELERACVQAWEGGEETAQDRTEQSGFDLKDGELVSIEFYGQEIEAVWKGGDIWVVVKRVCENLGIADRPQRRKIQSNPSLESRWDHMILPSDGGEQSTFCINMDGFLLWLGSISAAKVSPEASPMLIRYQREAMKALREYFFGSREEKGGQGNHNMEPVCDSSGDAWLAGINARYGCRSMESRVAGRLRDQSYQGVAKTTGDEVGRALHVSGRTVRAVLVRLAEEGYISSAKVDRRTNLRTIRLLSPKLLR